MLSEIANLTLSEATVYIDCISLNFDFLYFFHTSIHFSELQSNLSTMVKLLINNVKTLSKEIKRQKVSKGHEQKIVCKKCYINITFRDSLEDVYETWLILCNKKKC